MNPRRTLACVAYARFRIDRDARLMRRDSARKEWRFDRFISEHAFDKLRDIDCTFAEWEAALAAAEIIDSLELDPGVTKELLLLAGWKRPLHVVVLVDERRREERVLTIYEPDPARWTADNR